jgi:hypothetical protein
VREASLGRGSDQERRTGRRLTGQSGASQVVTQFVGRTLATRKIKTLEAKENL